MQDAEGCVVVAGDGDELVVGTDGSADPNEQSVFGDGRSGDIASQFVSRVMPGLVPGIHGFVFYRFAWMAGTIPGIDPGRP